MSKWNVCTIGDVITLQRGHDLPKVKMVRGDIPVAGSNGVIGYHNVATTEAPGVTIGRSGNLGNAFLYKEEFWAHNTTLYVKDFKGNSEVFVYYFLKNIDFKSFNVGSAVPTLNRNHVYPHQVRIPEPFEQQAIAEVLSSLDDKIDLLHRQNKTLETMAETLFRQWFVEEGQEKGKLGDLVENIRDSVSKERIDPESKYVALEHIEKRNISLKDHGFGKDVASNKYLFIKDDILFGKLRPYFHKVCLAPFSGICSTDILVLRPKNENLSYYSLFAFFQDSVVEHANLGSSGTRMPRTDWKSLSQYPIPMPNALELEKFNSIVKPLISKIFGNLTQIRTLENIRDTLLPKLMSGEVTVSINE